MKKAIFLCKCGNTLSSLLDLKKFDELKEENLVIEILDLLCQEEGKEKVKSKIKGEQIEGLIIGACSPKILEAEYQDLLRREGKNPYLLSIANLREQCAWVYPDKELANKKAKEKVLSSIRQLEKLKPISEEFLKVDKSVLILNGNFGGILASEELTKLGYKVILLNKKGDLPALKNNNLVEILEDAELLYLDGEAGNFQATIGQGGEKIKRNISAVLVTSEICGFWEKEIYGLELSDKIINLTNFSQMVEKDEQILKEIENKKGLITIVLGMSQETSSLPLTLALNSSLKIREKYKIEIYLILKNAKVYSQSGQKLYDKCRKAGVLIFKYDEELPKFILDKGIPTVLLKDYYLDKTEIMIPSELLVLEEKFIPIFNSKEVSKKLRIYPDKDNFLQSHNVHFINRANRAGIFVAGNSRVSQIKEESEIEIKSAVLEIHKLLSSGEIIGYPDRAEITKGKCTLCLTCQRFCPAGAITYTRAPEISAVSCVACGICASECPGCAIQIRNYTQEQVFNLLEGV